MIVHESMVNFGVGAEIAATIQNLLYHLQAPVQRLAVRTSEYWVVYEGVVVSFPDVASMLSRYVLNKTKTSLLIIL